MSISGAAGAEWAEPVVLRRARTADMFLLVDLADQVGYRLNPEWIRARLGADPDAEAHVVAVLHDVPIGAAHVVVPSRQSGDGLRARITALTVDEHHRAGRVGSRLLSHCEELAGRMGASVVEIAVPAHRHDLEGFWHRNGYEPGDSAPFVKRLGRRS
ncbi:GNAT family N-acetyltransferase [Kocuria sp. M1R5S2]|uniref:GNAT family N-acetyltransferase n=1 Tax=Kocuria rhizosphaerae TaxID=3376285 RepID=UPI0037A635A2